MPRRKPYSKISKKNQLRAPHVKGQGDVGYIGFQCLNPDCENFIYVRQNDLEEDFNIVCSKCSFSLHYGGETIFYDYDLKIEEQGKEKILSSGQFSVLHDEYLAEAQKFKYCIVCNTLKPLEFFDSHNSRKTKRQGECNLCKRIYNSIKNGTRLTDQHREAAQKRRLFIDIAGHHKIDSEKIYQKYKDRCFNCNKDLSIVETRLDKPLDHTLPVYYLWPLTIDNATLLCRDCNSKKSGSWPSVFYTDQQLKNLTTLTGFDYKLLAGEPQYNPKALEYLKNPKNAEELLKKYGNYMNELIKLRNRILLDTNIDFFKEASISKTWVKQADEILNKKER